MSCDVNNEYKKYYELINTFDEYYNEMKDISDRCVEEQEKIRRKRKLSREEKEKLVEETYNKYKVIFDEVWESLEQKKEMRDKKLSELASRVQFHAFNDWFEVDRSYGTTYSTQGFRKNYYAKVSLFPLRDKLESFGIPTKIEEKLLFKDEIRSVTSTGDTYEYILYAKCPEWMADAARRLITLQEWSSSIGRTTNPKVLNPFLPDSFLDVHFSQDW